MIDDDVENLKRRSPELAATAEALARGERFDDAMRKRVAAATARVEKEDASRAGIRSAIVARYGPQYFGGQ